MTLLLNMQRKDFEKNSASLKKILKMAENNKNDSLLASGFVPTEPEEITAEWLFEVINQYRSVKDLSPVKHPDDIIQCEIAERKTSHGYLSSTYIINVHFKESVIMQDFTCIKNNSKND